MKLINDKIFFVKDLDNKDESAPGFICKASDIVKIDSVAQSSVVYIAGGTVVRINSTLDELTEKLDGLGFWRASKGCIVNMWRATQVSDIGVKVGDFWIKASRRSLIKMKRDCLL